MCHTDVSTLEENFPASLSPQAEKVICAESKLLMWLISRPQTPDPVPAATDCLYRRKWWTLCFLCFWSILTGGVAENTEAPHQSPMPAGSTPAVRALEEWGGAMQGRKQPENRLLNTLYSVSVEASICLSLSCLNGKQSRLVPTGHKLLLLWSLPMKCPSGQVDSVLKVGPSVLCRRPAHQDKSLFKSPRILLPRPHSHRSFGRIWVFSSTSETPPVIY